MSLGPVLAYLKRSDRPTAVVCQTDMTAVAFLRAAEALGLRVPEELSVVGYNDQAEAAEMHPPLTTVAQPRRLASRAAIQLLLEAAAGRHEDYQTRVIECDLALRKTTAPPAG